MLTGLTAHSISTSSPSVSKWLIHGTRTILQNTKSYPSLSTFGGIRAAPNSACIEVPPIPSFASKQGGYPDSSPSYGGCALAMLASAKVATSAVVPYKVPHMVQLMIPLMNPLMVRHLVRRGRVNLI